MEGEGKKKPERPQRNEKKHIFTPPSKSWGGRRRSLLPIKSESLPLASDLGEFDRRLRTCQRWGVLHVWKLEMLPGNAGWNCVSGGGYSFHLPSSDVLLALVPVLAATRKLITLIASLRLPEHKDKLGRTENILIEGRTEWDPDLGNRTCSNVQSSPSAHAAVC